MNDPAQAARIKVAQLVVKDQSIRTRKQKLEEEDRQLQQKLREARNEMALLTASLFVSVESDEGVCLYGVSPEVEQTEEAHGLSLALRADGTVEIFCGFLDNSVTHLVRPGDQVSFKIAQTQNNNTVTYHIRVFKRKDDADEWNEQRRLANTSR